MKEKLGITKMFVKFIPSVCGIDANGNELPNDSPIRFCIISETTHPVFKTIKVDSFGTKETVKPPFETLIDLIHDTFETLETLQDDETESQTRRTGSHQDL